MKTLNEFQDKYSKTEYSNLNQSERDGANKVLEQVTTNKAVVYQTDKSKRIVIDKPINYKSYMQPHIEKDKVIGQKSLNKLTKNCNETVKSLIKIVGMGKESNQVSRVLSNAHVSSHSELPVLNGRFKDHKEGKNIRPVVNCNVGPLAVLSEILSDLPKCYIGEKDENTIKSTEELLAAFEAFNRQDKEDKNVEGKFIGSLDVISLYPSLKSDDSANEVK